MQSYSYLFMFENVCSHILRCWSSLRQFLTPLRQCDCDFGLYKWNWFENWFDLGLEISCLLSRLFVVCWLKYGQLPQEAKSLSVNIRWIRRLSTIYILWNNEVLISTNNCKYSCCVFLLNNKCYYQKIVWSSEAQLISARPCSIPACQLGAQDGKVNAPLSRQSQAAQRTPFPVSAGIMSHSNRQNKLIRPAFLGTVRQETLGQPSIWSGDISFLFK